VSGGQDRLEQQLQSVLGTLSIRQRALMRRLGDVQAVRVDRALYYQSEPSRFVGLVLVGRFRLTKYRADGSSVQLGACGPGGWLGLTEATLGAPYLSDAVASEPAEVLGYVRERFVELVREARLQELVAGTLARTLYRTQTQFEAATALERLTLFLRQEAMALPGARIVMTQDQIAQSVGLTRETVNRHLRDLSDRGAVTLLRGAVVVKDLS
jgi:CRP-like cAMP-binding protein